MRFEFASKETRSYSGPTKKVFKSTDQVELQNVYIDDFWAGPSKSST